LNQCGGILLINVISEVTQMIRKKDGRKFTTTQIG
jgi:hypothetical protein